MAEKFAGKAYASDVATIAAGATYTTDSDEMNIGNTGRITLQAYATGHAAGSAGVITFNLIASVGDKWSTSTWHTVTVTVSGTSAIVAPPVELDCLGIRAIKVDSIVNGDGAQAVDSLNIQFASPQRF